MNLNPHRHYLPARVYAHFVCAWFRECVGHRAVRALQRYVCAIAPLKSVRLVSVPVVPFLSLPAHARILA